MAKVMISIPDELLARLDEQAQQRGTTRSGLIQELARHELDGSDAQRRVEVERLLAAVRGHYGGKSTDAIRRDRDSR